MDAIVRLDGVSKWYGRVTALDNVSLAIPPGVTGLLGPNGAGKTTLIKILLGVVRRSAGRVWIRGEEIRRGATRFRRHIGYVPEDDCYLSGLTGVEMVFFAAQMSGLPYKEGLRRSHEILDFCGVQQERYRAVETYSTGMRQKIKFASAIVHDPPVLILDEPTSGLDPEERDAMLHRISLLARRHGKSILVSTHILRDVQAVCDHVIVLGNGRVVGRGDLSTLLAPVTDSWEVEIESGDLEQLAVRLREATSADVSVCSGHLVLDRGAVSSATLFTQAQAIGATIRVLRPARQSLERYFLEAVESQPDGVA